MGFNSGFKGLIHNKEISANEKILHSRSESADLVSIFICGLFYHSVSKSDYTASSGK